MKCITNQRGCFLWIPALSEYNVSNPGQKYKDAPAVSTELVKFLSMSKSIDPVEKLVDQMNGFKAPISELAKSLASVSKYGGTV